MSAVGVFEENVESDFQGTIIHADTVGKLRNEFSDSRRYSEITPFIFGFIDRKRLKIIYAEDRSGIPRLRGQIELLIKELERPLHAFDAHIALAVLFHFTGEKIAIDGELNRKTFETRLFAINTLNIPQYEDPFNDQDRMCSMIWLMGSRESQKCVAHVKACLLKERDILIKRGYRKPEQVHLRK